MDHLSSNSNKIRVGTLSSMEKLTSLFNTASLKQLISFVLNSSLVVKSLCLCIFFGYILSFKQDVAKFLSVVPGKLLPPNYYIWSLITHSFIEYRIIELLADWFIILLYSKMLEPLWGTIECIQFFVIITILVALISSLVYLMAFAFTFNELLLFDIKIHGLGGFLGAFSVATKQIMPDTILINLSFLRLKQDHLPLLLISITTMLYLIKLSELSYLIMLVCGILIGWIYLRFFQKHKNGTRGDSASTFTFASFFPSQIQPFVAIISNTIFNLLVKLKICKPTPKRYNISSTNGNSQSHITITIPLVNSDNSDAERRRIKALKALKERLKTPDDDDVKSSWNEKNFAEQNENISNVIIDTTHSLMQPENVVSTEEAVVNIPNNINNNNNNNNNPGSEETKN